MTAALARLRQSPYQSLLKVFVSERLYAKAKRETLRRRPHISQQLRSNTCYALYLDSCPSDTTMGLHLNRERGSSTAVEAITATRLGWRFEFNLLSGRGSVLRRRFRCGRPEEDYWEGLVRARKGTRALAILTLLDRIGEYPKNRFPFARLSSGKVIKLIKEYDERQRSGKLVKINKNFVQVVPVFSLRQIWHPKLLAQFNQKLIRIVNPCTI